MLKMGIMLMNTKYQEHLHLERSFRYLLVGLHQHKLLPFPYDTKLEYDVPTIIDEKYISLEYFPSMYLMYAQNVVDRN